LERSSVSLGTYSEKEEFEELCFNYGLEVEDDEDPECMRVEIAANRYDLLSVEGLAINLGRYLGTIEPATYTIREVSAHEKLIVKKSVETIREVCVCAILRGVKFTKESYDSFIDLQDKLHHNLGRKRTLVSFGTHDLDTIKGPFVYEALTPTEIEFVALNKTEKTNAHQLFEALNKDLHLKPFLKILEGKPHFPVIKDSNGVVLSLPPIINGEHSKISLNTKNVFIEVTATDYTKAMMGLTNIITAFSLYCEKKFEVEQVEIHYEGTDKNDITPHMKSHVLTANVDYMNKRAGINITKDEAIKLLHKMGFTTLKSEGNDLTLEVPLYRSDILHACDVSEDLAIAYGYNNIVPQLPPVTTIGKQVDLNKMTEQLRHEMATAGYKECLNFALCSIKDNTTNLNLPETLPMVTIGNSKTFDFQAGRTNLLSGLLKTLLSNKKNKLPIELFEVSDVVIRNDSEIGAANERHLAALRTNLKGSELSVNS
jgi:phenylalanyl-tRNA synthetase beta chain